MDQIEQVKKLREEYERALDAAESRRSAYHEAVLELYQGGTPLREIAKELGLSHQRVHQIVSGEPPPRNTKLPRAAGGAAATVLVLAVATFGGLRLAHAPPFARRGTVPFTSPRVSVAFRHGFVPGGAVLRRKREIVARAMPAGQLTLWVAPDRVSRSGHCSWLQVGRTGLGGSCCQPPTRGIPELVPRFLPIGSHPLGPRGPQRYREAGRSRELLFIWGRTGPGVDRLTLVFRGGKRMSVPTRNGMFLIAGPGLQSLWRSGDRPSLLLALDAQGHVLDTRPVRLDLIGPY